ncbi:MAG TPA: hypothetical protein VNJ08_04335 [Bacteriovoracaceae bacterium]|nr:hypothetical protein [Bacteriovoracaceae bacterium]
MKTFLVGGAVRDILMGRVPHDRDYLVIDTDKDYLIQQGFIPVGNAFTIFLHPDTKEEYTLAQDLMTDLERRDLTINAMAMDSENKVIDPFNGKLDLEAKVLRHVSAETFRQDPLRIYRVGRFKAAFPEFTIHPETMILNKSLTQEENFQNLPGERIFRELRKALQTDVPYLFFKFLKDLDALEVHFAGVNLFHLDEVKDEKCRYAMLLNDLSLSEIEDMSSRLLVPNDWLKIALALKHFKSVAPETLVDFFYKIDAFRNPHLVEEVVSCTNTSLLKSFNSIKDISKKDILSDLEGKDIASAIRHLRELIVKEMK